MADFLIECTQDADWKSRLAGLSGEAKLDTAVDGMPSSFIELFPEVNDMGLHYCVEPVALSEVPRKASRWWPHEETARQFMCYPAAFPESALYLSFDFEAE